MSPPDDTLQDPPAQAAEPPSERIPLPPLDARPAVDGTSFTSRLQFLDGLLVFLLLAFAFLATAQRLVNTNLFLHLATGRLIAQGAFPYSDPFTVTASEGTWVNHSWLFDLGLYLTHSVTGQGGEALSVLKALGYTLLAWLMFRAGSRPGERAWIPAFCTLLAFLALSPRSQLGPMLTSLLFLAGLLLLLSRHEAGSRGIWAAPVLCLFWANCDAWFFLGPVVMLLYLAGQAIQSFGETGDERNRTRAELPRLGVILAACVAACLVNPYFYLVFTVPPVELARWGAAAILADPKTGDPQFAGFHLSLLDPAYYAPARGLSAAGMALFPVALLGAISFAVSISVARWWRLLLWLGGLGLALLAVRCVPFFAIISAVVMALNFQEASERALGREAFLLPSWRAWAVSGRILTLFVALALCLLSVPGWLQATPHSRSRVGFGIEVDESLRGAALKVASWRASGVDLGQEGWLNLSPEAMNYFAWYCPGVRMFIDQRLPLFPRQAADDFRDVRMSLPARSGQASEAGGFAWRRVMGERGIHFVVFHFHQPTELSARTLDRMYAQPKEWVPCYVEGGTAIFYWRGDPGPTGRAVLPMPDSRLPINFPSLAFGPGAYEALPEMPPIPDRPWYTTLIEGSIPTPPEAGLAEQSRIRFTALQPAYSQRNERKVVSVVAAGLVGRAALLGAFPGHFAPRIAAGVALHVRVAHPLRRLYVCGEEPLVKNEMADDYCLHMVFQSLSVRDDAGPASSLYLGLRAVRRVLARAPNDPRALLLAGELYVWLRHRTVEGRVLTSLPQAEVIRRTQMIAPLVVLANSKADRRLRQSAHDLLWKLFSAPEYADLAAHHLGEFIRLSRELREAPNVPPEQLDEALDELDKHLKGRLKELSTGRNLFTVQSAGKAPTLKAQLALRQGLAQDAIRVLIEAKPEELGLAPKRQSTGGLNLLVNLLLATGRLDEARNLLVPTPGKEDQFDPRTFGMHPLGFPAYDFFRAQLAAASGDYALADKHLESLGRSMAASPNGLALLIGLDVLPDGIRLDLGEDEASRFTALGLGTVLLRSAAISRRLPFDFLGQSPIGLHSPHRPRIPSPGVLLDRIDRHLLTMLQEQAGVLSLRAWLALEQGRIADAKQLGERALMLTGVRRMGGFVSDPLTQLVIRRAEANEDFLP